MECEGELVTEDSSIVQSGTIPPGFFVVFDGKAAIYTVRHMEKRVESQDLTGQDIKQKYLNMSRRASVAIRGSDAPGAGPDLSVTHEEQKAKVALALVPGAAGLLNPETSRTNAAQGRWNKINKNLAPAPRRAAGGGPLMSIADVAAAMAIPVELQFTEGDAHGLRDVMHNYDAEAVKRDGFRKETHTVQALEDCVIMKFSLQDHMDIFREASDQNIKEKVELLSSIPAYSLCTKENLVCEKTVSLSPLFMANTIISPRQARDKHRENSKRAVVAGGPGASRQTRLALKGSGERSAPFPLSFLLKNDNLIYQDRLGTHRQKENSTKGGVRVSVRWCVRRATMHKRSFTF
jgi:hypothetical protein